MITLKIKPYNKHELELMYDVITEGLALVMSIECNHDCLSCKHKRVCRDLDETQEFLAQILEARQGK